MPRIVETSDKYFFIPSVQLVFTIINFTVLLLTLERLRLEDSCRTSYDQQGTLEGLLIGSPEDSNR
jgi:hypothetical protein